MDDLKKVFDIGELTAHELGCVEFVLNSPAYIDVFKPYLLGMRERLNNMLLDRSSVRKEEYSDDYLAGNIVAITGLLALFEKLIAETRMDRLVESQTSLGAVARYDMEQGTWQHDPVLGANEPIEQREPERVPPAEDY